MVVSASRPLSETATPAETPLPVQNLYCDEAPRSLLAFRAPEGRPPVLGEALDHAAAAACLAFAVIHQKVVLEIAELAIGLAMVAQRRAAGLDRLVQHGMDRIDQAACVTGGCALAIGHC